MGAADPRPFDDAEIDRLFAGLADVGTLGVAVSGGPDSTALLHLLAGHAARRARPLALTVLTVDHGLRAAAAAEAAAVADRAAAMGLAARVLVWSHDGPRPAADVQARARDARYRLLAAAARDDGLQAVALGHTLDDQAETVLIRLARGSGVHGLAGMPAERVVDGVRFVRPLLGVPKDRLVAHCRRNGLAVVDDPSNHDADRFLRARLRKAAPALAAAGLTPRVLAETARRLARAAAALDRAIDDLESAAATDHGGVVSLDLAALLRAPEEIALRLLSRLVRRIRPGEHPPRLAPLEAVLATAAARPAALKRTVAGVTVERRGARLWLFAEAGRQGFPVVPARPGAVLWDGRLLVRVPATAAPGAVIRAARGAERRPDLPPAAAASLPVVAEADGPENGTPAADPAIFDKPRQNSASATPSVGLAIDGEVPIFSLGSGPRV